jgi:pimeloyl-ACP methyl ester carboxylesterase
MQRHFPLILTAVAAAGLVALHSFEPARPTAHASFGRGPSIVLVHGLGSTRAHWLPTARLLARDHRVTLVDLPGHGVSDMPVQFSLEQAVTALDLALAERGSEPVVLVGHSLGGLVCAAEAIRHPHRVRGLVLVETALRPQIDPAQRDVMLAALDHDYASLVRSAYVGFGRDSVQGEALWQEVSALDPDMVRRWIRLAWTADLSADAIQIESPVLAVLSNRSWGTEESWTDVARALGYQRIPSLRAMRIADTGHFLMLDEPRALASAIERFTRRPLAGEFIAAR